MNFILGGNLRHGLLFFKKFLDDFGLESCCILFSHHALSISYADHLSCSGRVAGGALLPPSPLRTVLARLRAYGSSTSRTPRLLLLFWPECSSLSAFFLPTISGRCIAGSR